MPLPIEAVIPDLVKAFQGGDSVVLEAPPGAGKTTRVPLALLESGTAGASGKILMLEPRRLAVKAAAARMAQTLGEAVGERVGYRMRGESRVSAATRIEVITEGVLTRMLQSDPGLAHTGVVVFDEFHERNIDSDLGLALTLYGRDIFRDDNSPLKILVMSATLDGAAVAQLLGDVPVVSSQGRSHAVEIIYGKPAVAGAAIEPVVVAAIEQAVATQSGSILVFLPGKREIQRTQQQLADCFKNNPLAPSVWPLHGDMKLADQRAAVAPCKQGEKKVVLATSIAETSLTIDGVRVVIDSGLSRLPEFDPRTAMTRLVTRRVSRASAAQRAGRAGRTEPGVCYRLWSGDQHGGLAEYTPPQITQADLAPVALSLYQFGVADPGELSWLDAPPAGAYSQALALLESLGALSKNQAGQLVLTRHGEAMANLPVHPRLAHMLVIATQAGLIAPACKIAALLSTKDVLRNAGADIRLRVDMLSAGNVAARYRHTVRETEKMASRFEQLCRDLTDKTANKPATAQQLDTATAAGMLVACAYPDRIARRRDRGDYQLANGRLLQLRDDDPLRQSEWLAVAHVGGQAFASVDQAYLAAELDPRLFDHELSSLLVQIDKVEWPQNASALLSERQWCIGKLVLKSEPLVNSQSPQRTRAVATYIRKSGLQILPWTDQLMDIRARVNFLRLTGDKQRDSIEAGETDWPDCSDEGLLLTIEQWLLPWLDSVSHINHFAKVDLKAIFDVLLPWDQKQKMDQLAPATYTVPSGSKIRIDYSQSEPVLAVKLQEMLGSAAHPTINNGTLLKVALLSPARRPIQLTQDIAGFWQGSYEEVKKEMKGRYPKHFWPDDPVSATASSRSIKKKR